MAGPPIILGLTLPSIVANRSLLRSAKAKNYALWRYGDVDSSPLTEFRALANTPHLAYVLATLFFSIRSSFLRLSLRRSSTPRRSTDRSVHYDRSSHTFHTRSHFASSPANLAFIRSSSRRRRRVLRAAIQNFSRKDVPLDVN